MSNAKVLYLATFQEAMHGIKHTLLLLFFFSLSLVADAQVNDDFSDADFTNNPTWSGTDALYVVNASGQVQTNDVVAGQAYLSTPLVDGDLGGKEWQVWLKQSFAGSANNNSRYYLSSQIADLTFSGVQSIGANGYFLHLGEAGSNDAVRLFRDDNTGDAPTLILSAAEAGIAGSFEIRVKVTRDAIGNWSLAVDYSGGTAFVTEGNGFDDTYSTGQFLGMVSTYTASNANKCYFDDVYYGTPLVDNTAPEVTSLVVIDGNTLQISYTETVVGADILTNYDVGSIGNPNSIFGSGSLYTLNYTAGFPPNIEQEITIGGVADLAGNDISQVTLPFTYIAGSSAAQGDIVINEILADPSPVIGLPESEFVELYNTTATPINLGGWQFINTTTVKTLPNFNLPADGYVILCDEADLVLFESFDNVIGIPSFTALSNTADSLTLTTAEGIVVDIVSYTDDWYGSSQFAQGGITLERINPFAGCSGFSNWSASQSFLGGTPGEENSIFSDSPDLVAPQPLGFYYPDMQSVVLIFDEALNSDLSILSINISPDLGLLGTALLNSGTELALYFSNAYEIGQSYQLEVSGIEDCSGNGNGFVLQQTLLRGSAPVFGDLIINEIMADPDAEIPSPNSEYIELYNKSDHLIELTGVGLNNGIVAEAALIEPGGYHVLTSEGGLVDFIFYANVTGMASFPGLTNSGATITLYDPQGGTLDVVSYDIEWYQDPSKDDGGYSLELINPNDPCSDRSNWTASNAASGATAGAANSVLDLTPDTAAPELELILVTDVDILDFYFNEPVDEASLSLIEITLGLNDNGTFETLDYSAQDITIVDLNHIRIQFDGAFSAGPIYQCQLQYVSDCWENESGVLNGQFAVPEAAEPGDIVINEILFDPYVGGVDFVEVYNRSSKNISMQGWKLGDEQDGEPGNYDDLIDIPFVVYPGEYLVFATTITGVTGFYPSAREERIQKVNALPSYGNTSGVVVLADSTFQISDRFAYQDDMHYPLLDDTEGVSLERLDANRTTQDRTNWHSASGQVGFATPGFENSQYNPTEAGADFACQPPVFSPDNDGYEDQCIITYTLDQLGYTGSITVYDDSGRLIQRIVKNELLGLKGTVSWDGFDSNRQKSPIGPYIIVLEAFTIEGTVLVKKAVTTLGTALN